MDFHSLLELLLFSTCLELFLRKQRMNRGYPQRPLFDTSHMSGQRRLKEGEHMHSTRVTPMTLGWIVSCECGVQKQR